MFKLFDYVKIVGGFAKGFKGHIVDHNFNPENGLTQFKVRVYETHQGFTSDIIINSEHLQNAGEFNANIQD